MVRFWSGRTRLLAGAGKTALLAVGVGLAITAALTTYVVSEVGHEKRERVSDEADSAVRSIQERLQGYREVLIGVRSLFESVEERPSRERFSDFVRSLQVASRYPGIKVVSYGQPVEPYERAAFARTLDREGRELGNFRSSFDAEPRGRRAVVLRYLAPMVGNERAFGRDLLFEPKRRETVERTQRTGQPAATAPLWLIQHPGRVAFLYMVAIRDVSGPLSSSGTGRFKGVVSAGFDTRELLANVLSGREGGFDLEVYDAGLATSKAQELSEATLTYDSDGRVAISGGGDSDRAVVRKIEVGGRRWVIHYELRGTILSGSADRLPWLIALLGLVGSLMSGRLAVTHARNREWSDRRRAADTFQALLEAAPDAMVIVNDRAEIVIVNRQTELLLGYTRDALLGQPVEVLVPARFRGAHPGHRNGFFVNPGTRPMGAGIELHAVRGDGEELPVEISLSPLQTDEATFVSAAIRDISARKHAEQALREAEERFRRAFEDAGIGMALVSMEPGSAGRLLQVNDRLCAETGYAREDLLRMEFDALTHPDDLAASAAGLRQLLDGSASVPQVEQRILDASGRAIWVSMTSSLVRTEDGDPLYRIVQLQDVSERKRFEGQLQRLADHDPLTGLFNRRRFEDELARELSAAQRYGTGGAVLALDLDSFKYINDTLGHAAGDEMLAVVGNVLRARLRESDILARIGGDEFALILPHADGPTARHVAQNLLDAIRERAIITTEKGRRRTTASIGIAAFYSHPSELTSETLLVEADIAMYDAKEAGRDRYSVYDAHSSRHATMEARMTWAERIRSAIEDDRFTLHAQPIVSLRGEAAQRFELLLRMIGDSGELIPPGTFLYVAERAGLVCEIDSWVVRRAIRRLAQEQRDGNDVHFEVNLSARSITDSDLLDLIGRELASTGADPRGLSFEVTETAAIVNVDRAKLFARRLAELGCGFALDDFGTGFASFYYLKHLAFDYLKIDGEFIEGLASNHTNQLIVQSLVRIARGMGKETVAEFVCDETTVSLLRSYGVDYAQGFHIGRPVSIDEPGAFSVPDWSRPTLQARGSTA